MDNNLEEEELLRYDTNYKPLLSDSQNSKLIEKNKNQNFLRKSSTVSTTVSLSENGLDGFTPKKNDFNQSENNDSFSHMFFGRDRFYSSPISNYFDGVDNYFKGLYPEKNDYQNSNNYLRKEKYLRSQFGSIDKINSTNEEKNISNKIYPKLSIDLNSTNRFPLSSQDKGLNTSSHNYVNNNSGKFDCPQYYIRYYSVECK